jgi:hypothetical protein
MKQPAVLRIIWDSVQHAAARCKEGGTGRVLEAAALCTLLRVEECVGP